MDLNDELRLTQTPWWGQFLDASLEQQGAEMQLSMSAARRANALARLHDDGWSTSQLAEAAMLTRERVWQLIRRDRRAGVGEVRQ